MPPSEGSRGSPAALVDVAATVVAGVAVGGGLSSDGTLSAGSDATLNVLLEAASLHTNRVLASSLRNGGSACPNSSLASSTSPRRTAA